MSNVNITHSGNSKDQLGDLNQKLITAINTLDGSTLRDNLITSHQVDYMSTELIPAEAVENNQEHLVLNLKLKENYWYFFMKTLIKSIIYCQAVPHRAIKRLLIMYVVKIECQASLPSASLHNLSKSGNILFRSMANEICLFSSASIVIGRRYELRVLAAVELLV